MRFVLLLALLGGLGLGWQARAQVFYLDLNPQRISMPQRTLYVEQVLDGRTEPSSAIGSVYNGLSGSPAVVEFRRGLGPELTEWLQRHLPARPDDQAVALCVRQLRVNEVLSGLAERGTVELAFDVYAHLPDGYHFVRRLSDCAGGVAPDMTSTHAPRLAQLLQSGLRGLAPGPWPAAARRPALRLEQLAADQPTGVEPPAIVRAARPQRGVYYTAAQFLANHPDTTVSLTLETIPVKAGGLASSPQLRPVVRTAHGHRLKVSELWGLADGQQAYIQQGGALERLVQQGDVYTFMSSGLEQKANPIQLNYIPIPGGTGFVSLSRPAPVTGGIMVFALDMHTGQPGPYPRPGQPISQDTAYVYVYRAPGGSPEARRLLVNGQEVGWLRPGGYLEVPCSPLGRIMWFNLDRPDGLALAMIPGTGAASYVKLVTQPVVSWQWMPPHLGEADVDVLEKLRKP